MAELIEIEAYASTGAPMYETNYSETKDINAPTSIYQTQSSKWKKYVGKTTNVDNRIWISIFRKWSKSYKSFKPLFLRSRFLF